MKKTAFDTRELITFQIGQGDFCVDIMAVREIRGWTQATPLPHAPSYVRGVINLRGSVLSIIDLSARLGLGETAATPRHVIIVVQIGELITGLLVDAVTGILAVKPDMIMPTPEVAAETARNFIIGILAMEDRMINMIGLSHVMPRPLQVAA